jgi:hypothetical protein
MFYYSAQTKGFYTTEIHGANMPPDAVEISAALRREFLAGQAMGLVIRPPDAGHPLPWLSPPPAPPPEELAEARRAEIQAELDEIDRQSIRPLRAAAKGIARAEDTAKLAALETKAEELRAELAALGGAGQDPYFAFTDDSDIVRGRSLAPGLSPGPKSG